MDVRRFSTGLIAIPMALALVAATPSYSAEGKAAPAKKGRNVDSARKPSGPQVDAAATAQLADQLARYGDRNKDAIALIMAARLQAQVGVRDEKRQKASEGKPPADAGKAPAARDTSVSGLLARAKQYAGGRKDLIALADEAAKDKPRGAIPGPIRHVDRVNARTTDVYTVAFRGREPAVVLISGDGDTDLDLIVEDQYGNVICRSDGPSDDEGCRWTPAFTGDFRIKVRNLGNVWNQYRMLSN